MGPIWCAASLISYEPSNPPDRTDRLTLRETGTVHKSDQPDLSLIQSQSTPIRTRIRQAVQALHRQILNRLSPAAVAEDQLICGLKIPTEYVAPTITKLELPGSIGRQPGGLLAKISTH